MLALYSILIFFTSLFSYVLIDPNLTFFQTGWWVSFRNFVVYLGYYRRDITWLTYLIIILLLFFFNLFFTKNYKRYNPFRIALIIGIILLFSYPFLSHDFFNYMFDARILTFYHRSPYLLRALDFPNDKWLRFMNWTHRTYPYGPLFLAITIIPSFISLGKFVLGFFLFKFTFFIFYVTGVYFFQKIKKEYAIFFATNPLIIIEGLVNSHNDLISVTIAIVGIYLLFKSKKVISRVLLILSAGIKYSTFPLFFLGKNKFINLLILLITLISIIYISYKLEIQPWYFIVLFAFLPFFEKFIYKLNIFFAGLLLSYYSYIRLGGWGKIENIYLKHQIIIASFILNLLFIAFYSKIRSLLKYGAK